MMTIIDQIKDEKLQYNVNIISIKSDNKTTIKKYTYDPDDTPFISKQKKYLINLQMKNVKKITDLDKRVNRDDLTYRYKGNLADTKFDEFDNALGIINKIRDGKKKLSEVKNNQENFKSYLGEIKKGAKKSKEQKKHNTQY